MLARTVRLSAVTALLAGAVLGFAHPASAAVGPGTWTKVTTPSGTARFHYDSTATHNSLTVSGQASADVTTVDVDCVSYRPGSVNAEVVAAGVPVTGGTFAVTADITSLLINCRLRAIPAGVDPTTDYLGSYAGPIVYSTAKILNETGGITYGYTAASEQGDGLAVMRDAGQCGPALVATIAVPEMEMLGTGRERCAFGLPKGNLAGTASAIRVDGHNAYLPYAVHSYLNGSLGLGLTQPALTSTFTFAGNGDVHVVESATLMKCSVDDTYPPTGTSCPDLAGTGVKFTRVGDLFRGAHQIRIRDTLTAIDGHSHTVGLVYAAQVGGSPSGTTGFIFPGHGSTFQPTAPNQVVTGLGTKAGTVFIRSDIEAPSNEVSADTLGLTWSRAPSKVQFSPSDATYFAMPYSVSLPAGGAGYVGFAYSNHVATTDTRKLAGVAVAEVVSTPTINSPADGATITGHTTTVKGSVTLGANGLPTSVSVSGHAAHLTKVNASRETYSVTFTETFGQHTITVTAKDPAGNARSKSITIKNVSP
ncbi:MAG: hypothetical protein ACJ77A_11730 [Actinomycetota bacterium]